MTDPAPVSWSAQLGIDEDLALRSRLARVLLASAHDLSNPLAAARLRMWSIQRATRALADGADPDAILRLEELESELSEALQRLEARIGDLAAAGWSLIDDEPCPRGTP